MRTRLVSARLVKLLHLLRTSGELRFGREIALSELNRRVLSLVGNLEGLTSVELVALTGQEKAQISRAVAALSAEGLVTRDSLRAPVMLTDAGHLMHERFMAVGANRNDSLTHGLTPAALTRFLALTRHLIDRAALLLAREQEIAAGGGDELPETPETLPLPERLRDATRQRAPGRLVAPQLLTLAAYLARSATIAHRRETGLSQFAWRVLSQVGEYQPVTLATLITLVHRDKSQVGRAVKWLEGEGLVRRCALDRRRDVTLACTPRGDALYADMCVSARARDDFLFEGLGPADRATYLDVLDMITANGEALLAREQAIG